MSNNTSNVALPVIAMHEIGHGIGGAHAGVVTCDGEVPSSCGSDVVKNPYAAADKYSLMSYTGKDRTGLVFSSVDMEMMGLLSPREVIRANSAGSYTVSPFSVVGAKLLQLPGDVYVSVEALNLKDGPRNVVQVRALQKFEDTGDTFPMRVETPDMTAEEKEQGGFTQPGSTVAELPGFKVTLEGIKHDGTATLVVTKA